MKTLYVSDMDGTLLNSESVIPPHAIEALNRAIGCGALFTVATARTPATVANLLSNVNINIPAVVMTGATTWNPADNSYHNTCHFSPATAQEILKVYLKHRLPTFLYTLRDRMIYIYHLGPLSTLEKDFIRNRLYSPYKRFLLTPAQQESMGWLGDDYSQEFIDKTWEESSLHIPKEINDGVLFFAMQPESIASKAKEDIFRIPDINPMYYFDTVYPGNVMIEAFPKEASKANAVRNLANKLGADRIVAFGDNRNDLPLLEIADLAVAVDNAIPEVKEKADVIIGNCNEGAVADFILEDYIAHSSSAQMLGL